MSTVTTRPAARVIAGDARDRAARDAFWGSNDALMARIEEIARVPDDRSVPLTEAVRIVRAMDAADLARFLPPCPAYRFLPLPPAPIARREGQRPQAESPGHSRARDVRAKLAEAGRLIERALRYERDGFPYLGSLYRLDALNLLETLPRWGRDQFGKAK